MLEIIHNNCKKEQLKRKLQRQEKIMRYNKEQEQGKKMCKRIAITLGLCLIIETAVIIIERI